MKRLPIIIFAIAALVSGCTREDDITPITPSQSDQIHVQRIYMESYWVLETLDNLTGTWDTTSSIHTDKYLAKEWFWNGDRLDSIISVPPIGSTYIARFTYDNNGLLTRYDQEGTFDGFYVLYYYDANGRLTKFESYLNDTINKIGIIDSYVGDKISHMKYKDRSYDVDINYTFNAGNVTEMVVNGTVDDKYLHITYAYTYDNNPNPFNSCLFNIVLYPREPSKWMTANNILTEFTRIVEGDMEARDTRIEYEYRYENNLPVEKTYASYTGNDHSRITTINKEYYEY